MDNFQKKLIYITKLVLIFTLSLSAICVVVFSNQLLSAAGLKASWDFIYFIFFFLLIDYTFEEFDEFDEFGEESKITDFNTDANRSFHSTDVTHNDLSDTTMYNSASEKYTEFYGKDSNSRVTTDKFEEIPQKLNYTDSEIAILMSYYDNSQVYYYKSPTYEEYDTSTAWAEVIYEHNKKMYEQLSRNSPIKRFFRFKLVRVVSTKKTPIYFYKYFYKPNKQTRFYIVRQPVNLKKKYLNKFKRFYFNNTLF